MAIDAILHLVSSKAPSWSPRFFCWFAQSDQFRVFVENHEAKIRRKIECAKASDDLASVWFELEMAYLMLKGGCFLITYEPFGNEGGPDFAITYQPKNTNFYLEATRISKTDFHPQAQFEKWKRELLERVRLETSTLTCCVYVAETNDSLKMKERWKVNIELLHRLMDNHGAIANHIIKTAHALEDRIDFGVTEVRPVPNFELGEIRLEYYRSLDNTVHALNCYFGSHPIFKEGNEFRQFQTKFWGKLRNQMIHGKTNVLAISTDSKAHDAFALWQFIEKDLNEQAAQNNLMRDQLWSGVLFRGAFVPIESGEPNCLWFSPNARDYPISEEIRKALRELS